MDQLARARVAVVLAGLEGTAVLAVRVLDPRREVLAAGTAGAGFGATLAVGVGREKGRRRLGGDVSGLSGLLVLTEIARVAGDDRRHGVEQRHEGAVGGRLARERLELVLQLLVVDALQQLADEELVADDGLDVRGGGGGGGNGCGLGRHAGDGVRDVGRQVDGGVELALLGGHVDVQLDHRRQVDVGENVVVADGLLGDGDVGVVLGGQGVGAFLDRVEDAAVRLRAAAVAGLEEVGMGGEGVDVDEDAAADRKYQRAVKRLLVLVAAGCGGHGEVLLAERVVLVVAGVTPQHGEDVDALEGLLDRVGVLLRGVVDELDERLVVGRHRRWWRRRRRNDRCPKGRATGAENGTDDFAN